MLPRTRPTNHRPDSMRVYRSSYASKMARSVSRQSELIASVRRFAANLEAFGLRSWQGAHILLSIDTRVLQWKVML